VGHRSANLRVSLGVRAAQFRASSLRVRSHAGACSSPTQRTATGYAGRCVEVAETRSIAAFDWRSGAFLAKEVLLLPTPSFDPQALKRVCLFKSLVARVKLVPQIADKVQPFVILRSAATKNLLFACAKRKQISRSARNDKFKGFVSSLRRSSATS
jgi:hypothetical protein